MFFSLFFVMLQLVLCVLHKVVIICVFVKSWPWEINKVVFLFKCFAQGYRIFLCFIDYCSMM
jgi:hypothetical protein